MCWHGSPSISSIKKWFTNHIFQACLNDGGLSQCYPLKDIFMNHILYVYLLEYHYQQLIHQEKICTNHTLHPDLSGDHYLEHIFEEMICTKHILPVDRCGDNYQKHIHEEMICTNYMFHGHLFLFLITWNFFLLEQMTVLRSFLFSPLVKLLYSSYRTMCFFYLHAFMYVCGRLDEYLSFIICLKNNWATQVWWVHRIEVGIIANPSFIWVNPSFMWVFDFLRAFTS